MAAKVTLPEDKLVTVSIEVNDPEARRDMTRGDNWTVTIPAIRCMLAGRTPAKATIAGKLCTVAGIKLLFTEEVNLTNRHRVIYMDPTLGRRVITIIGSKDVVSGGFLWVASGEEVMS